MNNAFSIWKSLAMILTYAFVTTPTTVYAAYDKSAQKYGVFKVETIGDCVSLSLHVSSIVESKTHRMAHPPILCTYVPRQYVAVCGLPDPREDHALVMCRFARECVHKMNNLTKKLELVLGPDTGDLRIRIGLHSGPVTAGGAFVYYVFIDVAPWLLSF